MKPKNVIVTGGSRGIGRAIAAELVRAGHNLLLVARDKKRLDQAQRALSKAAKGTVLSHVCDVSDSAQVASLGKHCDGVGFEPNVLVHCAGIFIEGNLTASPPSDFTKTLEVDLLSSYYLVQAFIASLRKKRPSRIVLIGSTAGHEPYPVGALYGVAKWGLRGYAVNLRKELMSENIGVTLISPGGTLTDLWAGEDLPPNRLLEPADLGKIVATLLTLSDQAVVEDLVVRPMLGDMHD